ncbi:MAG: hypothetical protein QG646_1487 [Euryarchaeota archaeon]|nr:hypothetical protein [Euryarchaeota archaeon]
MEKPERNGIRNHTEQSNIKYFPEKLLKYMPVRFFIFTGSSVSPDSSFAATLQEQIKAENVITDRKQN